MSTKDLEFELISSGGIRIAVIAAHREPEGRVRKGQVLFEIDPRPFQAALDGAKGQLARANGQLAQPERLAPKATSTRQKRNWQRSMNDVERDTPLVAQKAVAKEKLDNEIQAKLGC